MMPVFRRYPTTFAKDRIKTFLLNTRSYQIAVETGAAAAFLRLMLLCLTQLRRATPDNPSSGGTGHGELTLDVQIQAV